MNLIFLGPPGAGKGTYSRYVKEKYDIPQISTGDLLREAVKNGTELGMKAKSYMDSGDLVPDELVIGLLKMRVARDDCQNGFILDGFPRTIPQAEALDESDIRIDKVINFKVNDEMVVHRISGRRIAPNSGRIYNVNEGCGPHPKVDGKCDETGEDLIQRTDDTADAVRNRLKVYHEQTAPLIKFYQEKGNLVDVDATQELEKVVKDLFTVLEE